MDTYKLKICDIDYGTGRIYYKAGKYIYCFQMAWNHSVTLFRCDNNFTPKIQVKHLNTRVEVELPMGENQLEETVNAYIKESHKCHTHG